MRREAEGLGIDIDQLVPPQDQLEEPEDFELWPDHWDAWMVFLRVQSQWKLVVGMGGALWTGLDYQGVDMVLRKVVRDEDRHLVVLDQLQVMEQEALKIRNK